MLIKNFPNSKLTKHNPIAKSNQTIPITQPRFIGLLVFGKLMLFIFLSGILNKDFESLC